MFGLLVAGCGDPTEAPAESTAPRPTGIITLGDVDPDEPATRVRRIQPLADFLAERLGDHGIGRGHVVVARNINEMAQLMADGKVDLYLDSPYPVLAVNRESGSQNLLLRQAKDDTEYWSVFVARSDAGITRLDDLLGKVVVFQEAHSTSGFLMPVASLIDRGYKLQAVARADSDVSDDSVGCYFSGDEENTIDLVLNGNALVGVVSNQDFREIPEQTREQLFILAETGKIPRQLVAARAGLEPSLVEALRSTLLNLTDEDRDRLAAQDAPNAWTWKFAPLSVAASDALAELESKMALQPACVAAQ